MNSKWTKTLIKKNKEIKYDGENSLQLVFTN